MSKAAGGSGFAEETKETVRAPIFSQVDAVDKGPQAAGASKAEWKHFAVTLGLVDDLLPVVSDQSVPISPDSKMKERGKTPSTLNRDGFVVGLPDWTQRHTTRAQAVAWAGDDRLGICLQTRVVRAIDIDVSDPALATEIAEFVELVLGPLTWRTRSNSSKRLALVMCPGELTKHKVRMADKQMIELLATGQQCIVAGTHPSGVRYEWLGGLPTDLPEVTVDELKALWTALAAKYGTVEVSNAATTLDKPRNAADVVEDAETAYYRAQWATDEAKDGKLFGPCPEKHLHSSDNGPTETAWFPPGLGGKAEGRFYCMHESCNVNTSLFRQLQGWTAIEVVDEFDDVTQPPPPMLPTGELVDPFARRDDKPNYQDRTKTGKIPAHPQNLAMALPRPDQCGVRLGFDLFKNKPMVEWHNRRGEWREYESADTFNIADTLQQSHFQAVPLALLKAGVSAVARRLAFDSLSQWVRSLVWDGVPRVDRYLADCWNTADTPYTCAVARYTWTALAGRAIAPGCKADMLPVFVGAQGLRKTSGVMAMAPADTFVELSLTERDDDLTRKMIGKAVGEIGELRGLAGKDADAIKQWISRQVEEWVPKYEEASARYPRRIVLFGTTNRADFLEDETGNRRWLPVNVGLVDTDRIRRERDQLWAEGLVMFKANGDECLWREAERLAVEAHRHHLVVDEWVEAVRTWLDSDGMDGSEGPKRGDSPFTAAEVLQSSAIGRQLSQIGRVEAQRVGKVLRSLGYELRTVREGGSTGRKWVRCVSSGGAV